jgi:hypothetical protein
MSALNNFATSVTNHTGYVGGFTDSGKSVGFDPMSIIMMISTILPPILEAFRNCKKKREEAVDPVSLRNHITAVSKHRTRSKALETSTMREIDNQLVRLKRQAAKASKGGGVTPDYVRFNLSGESRAKLAHNILGKFSTCSDAEAIAVCQEADAALVG